MRDIKILFLSLILAVAFMSLAFALDPPHDATKYVDCSACHITHSAPGGAITTLAGNANLCISCHMSGGTASAKPFSPSDQAFPWPGLAGANPSGTSHRWDSGPAGHVTFGGGAAIPSTGRVKSEGTFTGRYAKTYTVTITTPGNVGVAQFSWMATTPGGGSGTNILTGLDVPLDEGITVTFTDGTGTSFQLNDKWYVYVRTDIRQPSDPTMQVCLEDGHIMCSTCHDVHLQEFEPFDPNAPEYAGTGTGTGRHFQAIPNDIDQMCVDCHAGRNVTSATAGSHSVGVSIPDGAYKAPTTLPLDKTENKVRCTTCHSLHYTVSANGSLLRNTNVTSLCIDCHILADTTTPATHLNTSTGVLWPGGQYGSTFPQITDTTRRGFCTNCHQPHGWPDDVIPGRDYPKLQVEGQPNICFTCHDGSPASDQMTDFSATIWVTAGVGASGNMNLNTHHDVKPGDQAKSGSVIKCSNCHDPHTGKPSAKVILDPDPMDGRVPAPGQTWTGSDLRSEWCLDCHDGSFPSTITPPTMPLVNVRSAYQTADAHGMVTGNPSHKSGYGWARGDVVPCTACHDPGHGSSNLFQLRTTIYSKDGMTPIPSDNGSTIVAVTDNNTNNRNVNGYYFCNTCHTNSMGRNSTNCFSCHYHTTRF